jgi:hypothetical protein
VHSSGVDQVSDAEDIARYQSCFFFVVWLRARLLSPLRDAQTVAIVSGVQKRQGGEVDCAVYLMRGIARPHTASTSRRKMSEGTFTTSMTTWIEVDEIDF